MTNNTEPFEDRVGNSDREEQLGINDSVAGETVWTGPGNSNDGPTGGSAVEETPDYAPNDLARQQIKLGDTDPRESATRHHRSQPTTPPGAYASYDALPDDDDDSFDISLTDGPDLNAGDNIDTGAGRHRRRD